MKLKNLLLTAFAIFGMAMLTSPATQAQVCNGDGTNFVDLNGDGFNDNAPDHDGDGIPNGLDPDWIKNAKDGTGLKKGQLGTNQGQGMAQNKAMTKSQKFNQMKAYFGNMFQKRLGATGAQSGSGTGVCDGSGAGAGGGSGVCDGTGPKGQRRGGK